MKLLRTLVFLLSCVAISLATAAKPEVVGDFALLDHQGKFHQLSYYGDQTAVVILIHGNENVAVHNSLATLQELQVAFEDQPVTFLMLNPQTQDTRDAIAAQAKALEIDLPILLDESQLVAESLGATQLAQAFVINPQNMTLTYRGPIDAVQAVLAGQPVSEVSLGTGNVISYHSRNKHQRAQVSYHNDIVPILQANCVSCHHDGGIGPWSMSSHAMVRGWSAMMREVVMTRRMPPGQIDTHVSHAIENAAGLSTHEKQMLVHWIDAGSPMDSDADPLAEMTFNNPKFSLGEPDMVFKVPAQSIPATGVVDYRYIPVELNLDHDVWVKAMEFVPGDKQVLHHVIAYLASPADKTVRGRENGSARGDSVGGFAPGRQPDAFRDNSGRLIRKGSNLLLQMHYTTSGKASVDETLVGIYLHDKPPAYIMGGGVAGQRRFFVPAHEKEYKLQGEQLIERDAYLYSMTPHMHFRGKYMSYTALYPDGTSDLLLSVPKYDFNWQFSYQLRDPVFLPAGTRLIAKGAMDNSARNLSNPEPSKPVHFGLQTKHEMFFGFTTLRYVGDTPESLLSDKPDKSEDKPAKTKEVASL